MFIILFSVLKKTFLSELLSEEMLKHRKDSYRFNFYYSRNSFGFNDYNYLLWGKYNNKK